METNNGNAIIIETGRGPTIAGTRISFYYLENFFGTGRLYLTPQVS